MCHPVTDAATGHIIIGVTDVITCHIVTDVTVCHIVTDVMAKLHCH